MISCHIISDNVSYRICLIKYHIRYNISYEIISCINSTHMISYHIIYHTMSYHIYVISYIMPYHIYQILYITYIYDQPRCGQLWLEWISIYALNHRISMHAWNHRIAMIISLPMVVKCILTYSNSKVKWATNQISEDSQTNCTLHCQHAIAHISYHILYDIISYIPSYDISCITAYLISYIYI